MSCTPSTFCDNITPSNTPPVDGTNYKMAYGYNARGTDTTVSCLEPYFPGNTADTITVNDLGHITAVKQTLYTATSGPDSKKVDAYIKALLIKTTSAAPPSVNLKATNSAPIPLSESQAKAYSLNAATLRDSIKVEFCYYYTRYRWALCALLNGVGGSSMQADVQNLNTILNMILTILNGLMSSRNSTLTNYYKDDGINALNSQLDQVSKELVTNSMILQSGSLESDLKTAMTDYTLEKNQSSQNMLAIYGFMNIIAISLLYYAYTAK